MFNAGTENRKQPIKLMDVLINISEGVLKRVSSKYNDLQELDLRADLFMELFLNSLYRLVSRLIRKVQQGELSDEEMSELYEAFFPEGKPNIHELIRGHAEEIAKVLDKDTRTYRELRRLFRALHRLAGLVALWHYSKKGGNTEIPLEEV